MKQLTPPYKSILGTLDDVDTVTSIFVRAHSEGNFSGTSIKEDKVRQVVENLTTNGFVLLIKEEDNTVGMFMATISGFWWTDEKVACQVAWYILPEHRGKGIASHIIDAYQYWAQLNGCTNASVMYLENDLTKFYEGKGFVRKETAFMKAI